MIINRLLKSVSAVALCSTLLVTQSGASEFSKETECTDGFKRVMQVSASSRHNSNIQGDNNDGPLLEDASEVLRVCPKTL